MESARPSHECHYGCGWQSDHNKVQRSVDSADPTEAVVGVLAQGGSFLNTVAIPHTSWILEPHYLDKASLSHCGPGNNFGHEQWMFEVVEERRIPLENCSAPLCSAMDDEDKVVRALMAAQRDGEGHEKMDSLLH